MLSDAAEEGRQLNIDLEKHRHDVSECSTKMERVKCDYDKIMVALKLFERTYNEANAVNMADLVRKCRQEEVEAEEFERKRLEDLVNDQFSGHLTTVEKVSVGEKIIRLVLFGLFI